MATRGVSTAGIIAAEAGFQPPRSGGSAVFALDATARGSNIVIANDAQATPFSNANNFSGLVIINETAVDGGCALFLVGNGGVVEVADTLGIFTTTAGTASSINVYLSGGIVVVQNKRGGSRTVNVVGIRTRASS